MSAGEMTVRGYFLTWGSLMLLAAVSLALSFVPLGAWSFPVAIAIAAVKAALVVLFFMHVIGAQASVRLVLLAAGSFIALLISLMVADVMTRDNPGIVPPIDHVELPACAPTGPPAGAFAR